MTNTKQLIPPNIKGLNSIILPVTYVPIPYNRIINGIIFALADGAINGMQQNANPIAVHKALMAFPSKVFILIFLYIKVINNYFFD